MDDPALSAFSREWELLGAVAARVGLDHGNKLSVRARTLREQGLVESRFNGACLSWRLTEFGQSKVSAAYRYDPPEETEGPHAGMVRAVAERLWRKRRDDGHLGRADWADASAQVRMAWISAAEDVLGFLFDAGFTGPAGEPDPARFDGRNYAWLDSGCGWEILDSAGGFVALVNESTDLEILLAGPAMRSAIRALLDPLPPNHSLRSNPQIAALEAALPENRIKKMEEEDASA